MRSKVDLPQPDRADDADELARRDAQIDVVERDERAGAVPNSLRRCDDFDRRAAPLDIHRPLLPGRS